RQASGSDRPARPDLPGTPRWWREGALSAGQYVLDRAAVDALEAYHDQSAAPFVFVSPGAVVVVADAGADGLHEQPHRLAANLDEAFDAQHVLFLGRLAHTIREG